MIYCSRTYGRLSASATRLGSELLQYPCSVCIVPMSNVTRLRSIIKRSHQWHWPYYWLCMEGGFFYLGSFGILSRAQGRPEQVYQRSM